MKNKRGHHWRWWMASTVLAVWITCAIGFGRIEPVGKKGGVIQFDAINELTNNSIAWDRGLYDADAVWFARYWVCRDYYAVSVVWTEPHGLGLANIKTLAILSDKDGFRINEDQFPFWVPGNTTYPKPLGERGPFAWLGGFYEPAEMRFAEAEALSRRVYTADLELLKASGKSADGLIDLKPGDNPDGVKRKVTQLRVQAQAGRIESMDLLGNAGRKLAGIKYEYDGAGSSPEISRLVADLPVRPEKLVLDVNGTITAGNAKIPYRVADVDYVYHKGGRTCSVTYKDVTAGSATLRLPVQVEVRRSDDGRLTRSAKLMNFKRVDLDKAAVWEAAKKFGGFSSEDQKAREIANKFLYDEPTLGPLKVDPNDLAFVRRLIAKYPLPEQAPVRPEPGMSQEAHRQQMAEWSKRVASTPKPKPVAIEPNDARVIRQLIPYYARKAGGATEEEREKMRTGQLHGTPPRPPTESQKKFGQLQQELSRLLRYHRAPVLPEDRMPEPNDLDRKLIRQLHSHYESLVGSQNDTLGERLKVLDALWRLDLVTKDYDAFERRTVLYMQILHDANLPAMYMVGGYGGHIDRLIEAGQFDRAKKLLRQWVERSAADNDADAVYRFCGSDKGGTGDPWIAVQLLDRFRNKTGLSPLERYQGFALRAISLDKIDKLLATPQDELDKSGKMGQVRLILSGTTKAEIARRVDAAVREAVSAWQSLGATKDNEAKPYSTFELDNDIRQKLGALPDATRLQETSAQLDKIVQQRLGQRGAAPRSDPAAPPTRGTGRARTNR